MAKILFGAQEADLQLCEASIKGLEEAGHDVLEVSDAGHLLEMMVSGEGDLVIIFGGPMPLGSLAGNSLYAGFTVVALAREQGCETPVLILETLVRPQWAWELSNTATLWVPYALKTFLFRVERILNT